MSVLPDSEWRGAAAFLRQPVTEIDIRAAQHMVETIYYFNCRRPHGNETCLADIEYRSSDGEIDILRHVFRWDTRAPEVIFQQGFEARSQGDTPDSIFYNLMLHVNSGGTPLGTRRGDTTHAFVSTTTRSDWTPPAPGNDAIVYRYEIYAPGGIQVIETLGDRYRHSTSQAEVAFPAGIAPQYIRSAQSFRVTRDRTYTTRTRVDNVLYRYRHFNPQSHPQRTLRIQCPVSIYYNRTENGRRQSRRLEIQNVPEHDELRKKRSIDTNDELIDYYTEAVTEVDCYIDSAFRSTRKNEAYIFIKEQYVLINYAPGTTGDWVVNGPHSIGSSFHSLAGADFAEYGIDAAFGCHDRDDNEAMIFSGNLCARINYAPGTTDDFIIAGPKTIRQKFPFFRGTNFEGGIDAAFESTVTGEAYLFKGSEYALIDYSKPELIAIRPITEGFQCFRNTIFERGIGAAFASHVENEAYLFKGNNYVLLHFTPGRTDDYIVNGPKEIVPANWPSLIGIVPQKNEGFDISYEFAQPERRHPDHDDEL